MTGDNGAQADSADYEKQFPDGDILFPPISRFIRELHNNQNQLRNVMKPRYVMKKPAMTKQNQNLSNFVEYMTRRVMKKPAMKAKKPAAKTKTIQKNPAKQKKK